jgi:hypothetical protein
MIKKHPQVCRRGVRLNLTLPEESIAGCRESATSQLFVSSKIRRFSVSETPESIVRRSLCTRIDSVLCFAKQLQGPLNLAKSRLILLQSAKMNQQRRIQAINIMLKVGHRGFDFLKSCFQRDRIRLCHDVQLSILIVPDYEMPGSTACVCQSVTMADLTDDCRRRRFQFFTIPGSGFAG